jgi:hypothetical protein
VARADVEMIGRLKSYVLLGRHAAYRAFLTIERQADAVARLLPVGSFRDFMNKETIDYEPSA